MSQYKKSVVNLNSSTELRLLLGSRLDVTVIVTSCYNSFRLRVWQDMYPTCYWRKNPLGSNHLRRPSSVVEPTSVVTKAYLGNMEVRDGVGEAATYSEDSIKVYVIGIRLTVKE